MTPFRHLGVARSFTTLGHSFTRWVGNETIDSSPKRMEQMNRATTSARSYER